MSRMKTLSSSGVISVLLLLLQIDTSAIPISPGSDRASQDSEEVGVLSLVLSPTQFSREPNAGSVKIKREQNFETGGFCSQW
ncbi:hypothetical protein PanWU01x14_351620 [Parasponia andersonii]|uniref:Transmembrane protein n=1 Tax=Parasponia andersonii TaxID=3476 RepID=A0A2P5AAK1_PARAD|nr:hypothetical protein PanWU01x14_351620 [Parasponia andersonii]